MLKLYIYLGKRRKKHDKNQRKIRMRRNQR